jgi:thymidylate synthase (FAD)
MSGFLRLDGVCADDLAVVNSARVSFAKRKEIMELDDVGLVGYLMRNHHGTPFEHTFFRIHVRAPIFVSREWFRHRVQSYNEFSTRYAAVSSGAWVPGDDDVRTQVGKPGAYTFDLITDAQTRETVQIMIQEANDAAFLTYESLLEMGVAREVARTVLPLGTFTEFYASMNARALMHFCNLRGSEDALREIQPYSEALVEILHQHMPVTAKAWEENDRVAP